MRKALCAAVLDAEKYLGTHTFARAAQEKLCSEYDTVFKFAFVRHPWDRLVSWYSMIMASANDPKHRQVLENRLWQYVLANATSFEEFLHNCTATIDDVDGKKSLLFNQLDYITDATESVIVDFVGRYETLEDDAARLFSEIGVPPRALPRLNESARADYRSYHTAETKRLIATRFARDIDAFGYRF